MALIWKACLCVAALSVAGVAGGQLGYSRGHSAAIASAQALCAIAQSPPREGNGSFFDSTPQPEAGSRRF